MIDVRLPKDTALYTIDVDLDGLRFALRFDYSAREDRYYMSVYDADGAAVRRGLKVLPNVAMLRLVRVGSRPPSELVFFVPASKGADDEPPTYEALGRSVQLSYLTVETLEAEAAQVAAAT